MGPYRKFQIHSSGQSQTAKGRGAKLRSKSRLRVASVFAAVGLLLASCATVGTPVGLNEGNLHLLNGVWEGTCTISGPGPRVWSSAVTLEAREGSAKVTLWETGDSWHSVLRLKDGKVVVNIARGHRDFTLTRAEDGRLSLEASFEEQSQKFLLTLKKK